MMKVLRQILLLTAITVGFSLTAMAQRQQDPKKDPPPKENVPKISPQPKQRPDRPNDDKKDNDRNGDRKKPDLAFINDTEEVEII